MNRYDDNISPQPSSVTLIDNFKTPEISSNLIIQTHSIFPTPPSDNEDNRDSYHNKYQNEYLKTNQTTPIIDASNYQYYDRQNSFNNQYGNEVSNNSNDDSDILNPEKVAEAALSSSRFKRRSRTTFSKHQLDILEATFHKTQYPDVAVVDRLSNVLNLGTERISIWFQNRRARHKKEKKQIAEQAKAASKQQQHQILNSNNIELTWKQQIAPVINNSNKFAIERLTSSVTNPYQNFDYNNTGYLPTQYQSNDNSQDNFYNNINPMNYNQANIYYQPNYMTQYYQQYQTTTNSNNND